MNRFETLSGSGRALVVVCVALGIFVSLALLAEGAVRVRQWLKYGTGFSGIESLHQFDSETGLRVPIPNLKTRRIGINTLGFRGPDIAVPKPAGTTRLAFLGASTTFSAEASSNEATWPHMVIERLKERWPDRKFDYVNAGVPGYTVRTSLQNLEKRVKALQPDVIVIYHATNDLSANSYRAALQQGLTAARGDQGLSWLAQYSLLWYLIEKNLMILKRQWEADEEIGKLDVHVPALAEPFKRDLTALVQTSRMVANSVVLVTFSIRLRSEQNDQERRKAAITGLYYMPYMTPESLISSFHAYNLVIREVANEQHTTLIQDETSIPGDNLHFVDTVHFTDKGNHLMAERVTAGLVNGHVIDHVQ